MMADHLSVVFPVVSRSQKRTQSNKWVCWPTRIGNTSVSHDFVLQSMSTIIEPCGFYPQTSWLVPPSTRLAVWRVTNTYSLDGKIAGLTCKDSVRLKRKSQCLSIFSNTQVVHSHVVVLVGYKNEAEHHKFVTFCKLQHSNSQYLHALGAVHNYWSYF